MIIIGRLPVGALTVGGALLVSLLAVPAAEAGGATAVRYASPHGQGVSCSKHSPCAIEQAFSDKSVPAEIILKPGNYGRPTPLSQELLDGGQHFQIHGVAGAAPSVIYSSATAAMSISSSSLHDVTIVSSGVAAITISGGTVTRVVAVNTASHGLGCDVYATLTDSLCLATGDHGVAVDSDQDVFFHAGTVNYTIRNVTAEATSTTGIGLLNRANATDNGSGADLTQVVKATNDIIHGGGVDISVQTGSALATAKVVARHSDFATTDTTGTAGTRTVDANSTDISGAPVFVDAAQVNYQEKKSSPTIDMGAKSTHGELDLADNPRAVGAAPDIGAYEFLVKPSVRALTLTGATKHSLRGKVKIDGKGLPTKVEIVASRKGHRVKAVRLPHPISNRSTAHFIVHSLKRGTAYQLKAIAISIGGRATQGKAGSTR